MRFLDVLRLSREPLMHDVISRALDVIEPSGPPLFPRDCERPEPPIGGEPSNASVSAASRVSRSVMSAIRLRSGCGSTPFSRL